MRVAVYYAPMPDDPLWAAASAWLGWDAERGAAVPQPDLPGIAEWTASPRLYGFHATLKPPMQLSTDYGSFMDDLVRLAALLPPFVLPVLAPMNLAGFLALRETEPCPALHRLADMCVTLLDAHRAPPEAAELARRRRSGLEAAQEANLIRWGYPQVLDTWRFHMTLTRRLSLEEHGWIHPAAAAHMAAALSLPRQCTALSVFTQPGPGLPFRVAERVQLRG